MLFNLIVNLPIDLVGATVLQYLNIKYIYDSDNYKEWLSKDVLSRWKLKDITIYNVVLIVSIITLIVQTCLELTCIELKSDTVDDAIVMAVAKHCRKLEKFKLPVHSAITYNSLIALSERGLPLIELDILDIPNIPTADIARRCSHALSCIRTLNTNYHQNNMKEVSVILPYMTGLTSVFLANSSFYIPLLIQHCHRNRSLWRQLLYGGYIVALPR